MTALSARLYVGWNYVGGRLDADVVVFEESGWYDGQDWVKPNEVRTRDQLIYQYEVKPVLDRLKVVLGGCAAAFVVRIQLLSPTLHSGIMFKHALLQ
ncbi:unnamed protein product [Chrysoparadoxa australica]